MVDFPEIVGYTKRRNYFNSHPIRQRFQNNASWHVKTQWQFL